MKKLKDKELPLPILYTYDSFLFEFSPEEKDIVKEVKSVLESFGFPTKVEFGNDYSEL